MKALKYLTSRLTQYGKIIELYLVDFPSTFDYQMVADFMNGSAQIIIILR